MTAYGRGGGKRLSALIFKFGRNENELSASHAGRFTPTHPRSKCLGFPLERKLEGRFGKEKNLSGVLVRPARGLFDVSTKQL
jgi:hypothetical protein